MWDLLFDRYGHIDWIFVGVALLLAVGLSTRAWLFLRPHDRALKLVARSLTVFVFVGGGCILLYLGNIVEKLRYWDVRLIDLVGCVPVIAGVYFFWDFFIRKSAA